MSDPNFSNQDFRDAFLVLLGGMVTHKGVNLADESAYRSTCANIEGLALQAEKVMAKHRGKPLPISVPIELPARSKSGKALDESRKEGGL